MLVFRPFVLTAFFTVPILFLASLPGTSAAQDVRHMCSEKYQAAKAAGTLGDETWPQFYSQCAAEMKANPPAPATPSAAKAAPAPLDVRHICSEKYQAAKAAGTLAGESWPQFYSRCTAEVKANPPAAAPPAAEAAAKEEKAPAAPPPAPVVEAPKSPPLAPVVEAPPPPPPAPVAETPAPPPAAVNPLKKPVAPAAAASPSAAVFPTAIAPEFAKEKPAKARMKTCDAQYKANKATNANGGLKWIQKGGGYWSECNKRLKGE
jgi:hypothetical protein